MCWIQTNLQKFQPLQVKWNIQNVDTLLHKWSKSVICMAIVSCVSSQKVNLHF